MTGYRGPPLPGRYTKVLRRVPSRIATIVWKQRTPLALSTTCMALPSLLTAASPRAGRGLDPHSAQVQAEAPWPRDHDHDCRVHLLCSPVSSLLELFDTRQDFATKQLDFLHY